MDKFKELNLKIEKTKNKRIKNDNHHKTNVLKNDKLLTYILSIIENIEYLINNNYIDNDEYQNRLKQIESIYIEIKRMLKIIK